MGLAVDVMVGLEEGLGDGLGARLASVGRTMDAAVGAGLFSHPAKRVSVRSKQ